MLRKEFVRHLTELARHRPEIIVLALDVGYGVWDEYRAALPNQFYAVGACEQAGIGTAVGLALRGKVPIVYSITPFLLRRADQWLHNYLDAERIRVVLVGSGVQDDYAGYGLTHDASDAQRLLATLPGIKHVVPGKDEMSAVIEQALADEQATFIQLRRGQI